MNRIKSLSVKIILMLFLILFAVTVTSNFLFFLAQEAGFKPPSNELEVRLWLRLAMVIVSMSIGISIASLLAFAINKTVVSRIKKLEDAANEVAKGNFDVYTEVIGCDELSRLTDSFNMMSAELRANEYLSKEFVRNISHEFKTPISAIRAYCELLESEAQSEKVKEYAQIIQKESDRLANLSKSILQLSLIDSTTFIKKEDIVNPAMQMREIFRLMQAKWTEKNLTLDLQLEEFSIQSNEQLLFQVWQNLIGNAIKFSLQDGKITVVLRKSESGLYAEIADNGIGIKEEDRSKVFNHFFVADKSRNSEGSGLGLPIVKNIVKKLDGEIGFESEEGKGTSFKVKI